MVRHWGRARWAYWLALATVAFDTRPAAAQPADAVLLPEVEVTATRSPRPQDATPRAVSVVTRDQIERSVPNGARDLLQDVPGLLQSPSGGLGGQINLRGFSSNDFRNPLFIDGDRFRGRNTLEYNLLDPNDIERIEVLRGPAAALYGTDSFGGLVNIITRRAEGDVTQPFRFTRNEVNTTFRSAGALRSLHLSTEGVGSGFDARISASGRRADDYHSPDERIRNSGFEALNTTLRLGYTLTPGHRVEVIGRYNEAYVEHAGGVSGAPGFPLLTARSDPIIERFGRIAYTGRWEEARLARIESSFYVRSLDTENTTLNRTLRTSTAFTRNFVLDTTVYGGKLLATTLPWWNNRTTFGVDWFIEDRPGSDSEGFTQTLNAAGAVTRTVTSRRTKTGPDSQQTNVGAFIHNDWDPVPWLTLSLSGRADRFQTTTATDPLPDPALRAAFLANRDTTETPLTGSAGAVIRLLPELHLVGSISSAFRAPSATELFGAARQGTGFLVPNPELRSERAVTAEGGVRVRLGPARVNLVAFHSEYEDLIVRRAITYLGTPSTQRQNVGSAEIQGLEFDGRVPLTDTLTGIVTASALRGTDTQANRPLPYIAPFFGSARLRYDEPDAGWWIEGSTNWAASKTRVDRTQERPTVGFAIVNLALGMDLRQVVAPSLPASQLVLGIENLFNTRYRNPTTVEDVRFASSATNPLVERGIVAFASLRARF